MNMAISMIIARILGSVVTRMSMEMCFKYRLA
jgi:hypothetical protein